MTDDDMWRLENVEVNTTHTAKLHCGECEHPVKAVDGDNMFNVSRFVCECDVPVWAYEAPYTEADDNE